MLTSQTGRQALLSAILVIRPQTASLDAAHANVARFSLISLSMTAWLPDCHGCYCAMFRLFLPRTRRQKK